LPAIDALHERFEVPAPPGILVEDRVQERLVELEVAARVTVPLKPLTGATVTVDAPVTFVFALTVDGFAAMVKSCTW